MGKPVPNVVVDSNPLYVSAPKIHPRSIDGRFQRLRAAAVIWLLGMYYVVAWIPWGDRQAVLFDLPARKFHIFGLTLWPQDFVFLAALLMIAGFALFFFTALAGRLWCGYACPQTVWTEVFVWIERWFEGDRSKRIKLDAAPWSREKLLRKGGKHLVWGLFALWTGYTFVGYFVPIREFGVQLLTFGASLTAVFWMLFYALATWGNAGFLREQVCKYMCPYARFQGAMFDQDTLSITYDTARGEARGSRRRDVPSVVGLAAEARPELGDCIDCTICVQVCPTGIDIRDGLQYECIGCAACIDACDQVMDKVGYPRGLIRYTTQNALEGRPSRVLRPRILVYALLLVSFLSALGMGLWTRSDLHVDVLRDRKALYREARDGQIENSYTLKLINKSERELRLVVEVQSDAALSLRDAPLTATLEAGSVLALAATVHAPRDAVRTSTNLRFVVSDPTNTAIRHERQSNFFAPD